MKYKRIILIISLIIFLTAIVLTRNNIIFELTNENISINYGEQVDTSLYNAKVCNNFFKSLCKDLKEYVISEVNQDTNLSYIVEYRLQYKKYNNTLKQNVSIIDKQSPVISISTNNFCEDLKDKYQAIDNIDGDITQDVIISNEDDNVCFYSKDSSGNENKICKNKYETDTTKPKIKLKGNSTVYLNVNSKYKESGYTATDNCEGDITNKVKVYSNLKNDIPGKYTIKYSVKDKNNNETTVTRNIIVNTPINESKPNDQNKPTTETEKNGKVIYLTFDDGPYKYTEDILKVLKKYNVKATFFVTNQFSKYQNLIGKAYSEGHTIAIHTYSHQYKSIYSSVEKYFDDLLSMNNIIKKQTGNYSNLVRFPGGSSNTISRFNKGIMTTLSKKLNELGYTYFDWNVDSKDTTTTNSNKIANNVINGIKKRTTSVVLLHDIKKANIKSVELIIKYGLENGYTFKALTKSSPTVHHGIRN